MLNWVLICRTVSHSIFQRFIELISIFSTRFGCQCFSLSSRTPCIFLESFPVRPIVLRSGPSLEAAATGQLAAGEVFTTAEVRDNILRLQAGQGESTNAIWKKEGGWHDTFFLVSLLVLLIVLAPLVASCLLLGKVRRWNRVHKWHQKCGSVFSTKPLCLEVFQYHVLHRTSRRVSEDLWFQKKGRWVPLSWKGESWRWQLCCLTPPPLKAHKGCWLYVFHSVVLKYTHVAMNGWQIHVV